MRVAVTGARGDLGRGVVAELVGHEYDVIAIHRTDDGRPARAGRVENRVADLADRVAARSALEGCDAVCHLAAIPNPRVADAPTVFINNTVGTVHVLQASAELGIRRVIHASSQSVLGNAWAPMLRPILYAPVDEAHPCVPFDPYGLSKVVAEQTCDLYARMHELQILSLRLPAIWLPDEYPQRIQGRLTDQLQAAKSIWAYVDQRDAAIACRLALQAEWQGHAVLNIASRWAFGAAPVPELLAQWYPDLNELRAPIEDWTAVFDWHKAERLLGFRARYRWLSEGIFDVGED
jgi:nucleoside-diphosphate-sugar epimerase